MGRVGRGRQESLGKSNCRSLRLKKKWPCSGRRESPAGDGERKEVKVTICKKGSSKIKNTFERMRE